VRTERPIYRASAPQRSAERELVVLFCDFLNRAELASDHLPQDLLYVMKLYVEVIGNAIRGVHGALSYVELDSICALFGLECDPMQAAQQALCGAHDMPFAVSEQVFTAAGLVPTFAEKITLPTPGGVSVAVCLFTSGAALAPATLAASHSAVPNFLRKLRA
jgi:class 3 adenylate cyclase